MLYKNSYQTNLQLKVVMICRVAAFFIIVVSWQMFKCAYCPAEYGSKSSLYTHKTKMHSGIKNDDPLSPTYGMPTAPPMFNCEVCGKALKGKDSLRDHMLIHDGPRCD